MFRENRRLQYSHVTHSGTGSLSANISQSNQNLCLRLAVTNLNQCKTTASLLNFKAIIGTYDYRTQFTSTVVKPTAFLLGHIKVEFFPPKVDKVTNTELSNTHLHLLFLKLILPLLVFKASNFAS